ncbi:MAG: arginine--tRNA ligase [Deferribacteres bacterium]|nr:arginine--tRNA ligase [candidate division KSB1 bacterium]MCB9500787.1 arginine--tRNA ligase [Deferribacteres bacterium]
MKVELYIAEKIKEALKNTYDQDATVFIEKPRQETWGDFATTVALGLAKTLRKAPRQIAETIVANIADEKKIFANVTIDGPGFINITLSQSWWQNTVLHIIETGERFGEDDWGNGQRINLEFVSANPTGPLNVVSARAAATGDVLVELLNKVGFAAEREYYINDAGRQIRLLGASVAARYMTLFNQKEDVPEDGYQGDYIIGLAEELKTEHGDKFVSYEKQERQSVLAKLALEKMIALHKKALHEYRIDYQTWFCESALRDKKSHFKIVEALKAKGLTYEKDGALWFKSSEFGDAKDRVLVTNEGEPTYFMVDIAYHQNKFDRGFEVLYDLWGPDHHGYIDRVSAALQALGHAKEEFNVRIIQQVNMLRDGELVKMSKRAGNIIEMNEVLQDVGIDAARFFFVMRKLDSPLDFDIDLAKKRSDENPVFYVQYAHARIVNVIQFAKENGLELDLTADLSLLTASEEIALIRKLNEYPNVVSTCARLMEVHHLPAYLMEVAAAFHSFYHNNRIVTDDRQLSNARMMLLEATRSVLVNGLKMLRISAPERM